LFKYLRNKISKFDKYSLSRHVRGESGGFLVYIDSLKKEENVSASEWDKIFYVLSEHIEKNPKLIYKFDDVIHKIKEHSGDWGWEIVNIMTSAPETIDYFSKKGFLDDLKLYYIKDILKKSPHKSKNFTTAINKLSNYEFVNLIFDVPELDIKPFRKKVDELYDYYLIDVFLEKPDIVNDFSDKIKTSFGYMSSDTKEKLGKIIQKNPMAVYYFYEPIKEAYPTVGDLKLIFPKGTTKGLGVLLKTIEKYGGDFDDYQTERLVMSLLSFKPKTTIKVLGEKIRSILSKNYFSGLHSYLNDNPEVKKLL